MNDYAEYELAKLRQAELMQEAMAYRRAACSEPLMARLAKRVGRLRSAVASLL